MKRSSAAVFTTNLILLCTLAISCVTSQAGTLPLPIDGLNEAYNQGLRNSQTVVTSTVGSCLDSTLAERTTHVWFYWTGEPSSAKLILTTRGVRADVNPRIYVNGQDIGQAVPDVLSYQPCEVAGGAENESITVHRHGPLRSLRCPGRHLLERRAGGSHLGAIGVGRAHLPGRLQRVSRQLRHPHSGRQQHQSLEVPEALHAPALQG